jgi:hypothetical protein
VGGIIPESWATCSGIASLHRIQRLWMRLCALNEGYASARVNSTLVPQIIWHPVTEKLDDDQCHFALRTYPAFFCRLSELSGAMSSAGVAIQVPAVDVCNTQRRRRPYEDNHKLARRLVIPVGGEAARYQNLLKSTRTSEQSTTRKSRCGILRSHQLDAATASWSRSDRVDTRRARPSASPISICVNGDSH